jgi:hypothetical protein
MYSELKLAVVRKLYKLSSLGNIAPGLLPVVLPYLPKLITVKEFKLYPDICMSSLKGLSTIGEDLAIEVLKYLNGKDSLLLESIPEIYVERFMLSDPTLSVQLFQNYMYMYRYYYGNSIGIDSLNYGLRRYGQNTKLRGLSIKGCIEGTELPPIRIAWDNYYVADPKMQSKNLLRLYVAFRSDNLEMDHKTFMVLLADGDTNLLRWKTSQTFRANASGGIYQELVRRGIIDDSECPICYGTLETPMVTRCGHEFHRGCLGKWLTDHDTCPLCRTVLLRV